MSTKQLNFKLCKYTCNTDIGWDTQLNAFVERDGRLHDRKRCESLRTNNKSTVQQTQQEQRPAATTSTSNATDIIAALNSILQEIRNEMVKSTDGIHRLANEYEHISRELVRLNDYYDGLVTSQKGTAAILSQYLDKNQRMADAEVQYDQDKEDGLV